MRDQTLIQAVLKGDPRAHYEFYYTYVDRVHRHLYSILGPDPDIEDVVQQTFTKVFKHVGSFRGDSRFTTWLHRVAVNVALSHLRKRKRWYRWDNPEERAQLPEQSLPEQPDELCDRQEKMRVLYEVLAEIKPKKRVCFVLYEIEGHTLEEIADVVEAPVNTVATRLRAARKEVRRALRRRLKLGNEAVA